MTNSAIFSTGNGSSAINATWTAIHSRPPDGRPARARISNLWPCTHIPSDLDLAAIRAARPPSTTPCPPATSECGSITCQHERCSMLTAVRSLGVRGTRDRGVDGRAAVVNDPDPRRA